MEQLFIFADIHGSLTGWLSALALTRQGCGIAVAGDLFDTRYGSYGDPDFRPGDIRSDISTLAHPFYYVYGNCDVASFLPGHDVQTTFDIFGRKAFLHHGHRALPQNFRADIVIQGHTHVWQLETHGKNLFINPGSLVRPRKQEPTYAVIDKACARIIALKTGRILCEEPLP